MNLTDEQLREVKDRLAKMHLAIEADFNDVSAFEAVDVCRREVAYLRKLFGLSKEVSSKDANAVEDHVDRYLATKLQGIPP